MVVDGNTKEINRAIGKLNHSLATPIIQADVIDALSQLDVEDALKIVTDLGKRGGSIKDPTGWIKKAASNALEGKGPEKAQRPPLSDEKKISKAIGWLNANGNLQEPLRFNDVIGPLSSLDVRHAQKILKDVEERGEEIKNPTRYVEKAALNALGAHAAPAMAMSPRGSSRGMAPARVYAPPTDPTGKIGKTIGWMNKNAGLQAPLRYNETVELLSACDARDAMKILKDVEEKGSEIRDPTAYVQKAASRKAGQFGGAPMQMMASPMMMPNAGTQKQISRKIGELNKHGGLQEPLQFNETIGLLNSLHVGTAMKILEDLEKKAGDIKSPTGYVSKAAKNAAAGGGGAMMMPAMGGYGPAPNFGRAPAFKRTRPQSDAPNASPSGEDGKKISQAVGWLNKSGGLMDVLQYSEVKPHLESLDVGSAQKILEDLERAAGTVKDPTGYVVAAAKRAASGQERPKRQRT